MSIKNKKLNRSGFSLVEVLMATFVFSVIMVGVAGAFSSSVFGYKHAKNTQKDLEQAQFAMNLMAKTIRTSSVAYCSAGSGTCRAAVGTGKSLRVYDHSQSKCFGFTLDDASGEVTFSEGDAIRNANFAACNGSVGVWATSTPMVSGATISGTFSAIQSCDGNNTNGCGLSPRVGKVTISMEVGTGSDVARLQTTVSLRDYTVSGL